MRTGPQPARPRPGDQRAAEHDGRDQDGAVDDLQPRRIDLEVREQVLQQVDRERAEDGADQPAAAARERRAAEHERRDGEQCVLRRVGRVRRLHQRGEREAADAGEEAAEPVARDAHGRDVHAGREGGRVVEPTAKSRRRNGTYSSPNQISSGAPIVKSAPGNGPTEPARS